MTKGENSIMDVSLNAERLSEQYFSWYKNNTDFKQVNKNIIQINLPFTDNFADELTIYAVSLPDGRIKVTDDGWTVNNLESVGVSINHSPTRKKLFETQLRAYGVTSTDSELSITADVAHFSEAKHRLLQGMLLVNDMFMLKKQHTTNYFIDDVNSFFEEKNIRTIKNVSYMGSSGLSHKFEFSIPGIRNIPTRLIKTMTNANNSMFAMAILANVEQTEKIMQQRTRFYVFLNDLNREKQQHSVSQDVVNLFEQNRIKAVRFSERESYTAELAE